MDDWWLIQFHILASKLADAAAAAVIGFCPAFCKMPLIFDSKSSTVVVMPVTIPIGVPFFPMKKSDGNGTNLSVECTQLMKWINTRHKKRKEIRIEYSQIWENCLYASLSLCTFMATKSSLSSLVRILSSLMSDVNVVDNSFGPIKLSKYNIEMSLSCFFFHFVANVVRLHEWARRPKIWYLMTK